MDDSLSPNTNGSKAGKRAGRKQIVAEPVDERHRKNLEAQRAFRERRANHISSLEKQVADLKAIVDARIPVNSDTETELLRQQLLAVSSENSILRASSINIDLKSSVPSTASQLLAGTECVGCGTERLKTLICMGQIKQLEGKVTDLLNENQVLKSLLSSVSAQNPFLQSILHGHSFGHSPSPADGSGLEIKLDGNNMQSGVMGNFSSPSELGVDWSDSSNGFGGMAWTRSGNDIGGLVTPTSNGNARAVVPMSATELYGPPECEFAKIALRSIPSIKDSKFIDEVLEIFTVLSSCVDPSRMRKYMIRFYKARTQLMDSCSMVDRQKVVEIFVMFLERNKRHSEHRHKLFAEFPGSEDPTPFLNAFVDNPDAKRFRDAVVAIPSLANSEAQINKLCMLLWAPNIPGKGKQKFDMLVRAKHQLENKLVTLEEKTAFRLAMETSRYARDKNSIYALLDEVASGSEEE